MKKVLLLALMAVMTFAVWAQNPEKKSRRFDPQKFQQMVEESLTKAGELTPEEAKVFFPLYNEMREKQRNLGREIHQLKKNADGEAKDYAETITKIKQIQVDMAKMELDYYKRILKVLPPEKVFKVMKAEDDLHRRMVQGQRPHRQGMEGARHAHRPRPQQPPK